MTQAQEPKPNSARGPKSDQPPGVPGWVKISAIVVAVLVLVLIVVMLLGGNHGPARHSSAPIAGPSQLDAVSEPVVDTEHLVW